MCNSQNYAGTLGSGLIDALALSSAMSWLVHDYL